MALQSSGQISLNDIKTELGAAATNVSLRSMSATAGKSSPDAISEFYGYTHSSFNNDYALDFDGVNDYVLFEPTDVGDFPNDTMTLSFWVRVDQSTKSNMIFYCTTHEDATASQGRLIIFYHSNFNRIIAQYFITSGSNKVYQRQFALHDNSGTTGITNGSTGWTSGQRGNTDSDGYTHIAVALDRTRSSATDGVKVYWNGTALASAAVTTNTMTTSHTFDPNFGAIGEGTHAASKPSAAIHDGVLDEMYLYDAQLSSSAISTIYGYGRNSENTYTTNYKTAWRFENSVDDEESLTTTTNYGATFISL